MVYLLKLFLMKYFKFYCVLILAISCSTHSNAQSAKISSQSKGLITKKPKLVIGLVVDQMRWDYLYRFEGQFGANGFKKLMNDGFNCENTIINYISSNTAAGHAAIFTGSVPAINGIIGNNWYDRIGNKNVYCSEDTTVKSVGSNTSAGLMSPRNLWTNTITDELRLSNNFTSKVIGIALKDRGAIFPAGHTANAAYWFDDSNGKWITSNYYMDSLPSWVNGFNNKMLPSVMMSNDWNTMFPSKNYSQSSRDQAAYEESLPGEKTTTFPHKLSEIKKQAFVTFRHTPFGNTFSFDFAKSAIINEQLGKGATTDFLTLSLSSTDYIGHDFGPNSVEIQDTYIRLDRDIAEFLNYLDKTIGRNNYLIFLTADHGASHVPDFLNEHKMEAGKVNMKLLSAELNAAVEKIYGIKKSILKIQNYQVYLNYAELDKQSKNIDSISTAILQLLKEKSFVQDAIDIAKMYQSVIPEPIKQLITNGYSAKRSGDIQIVFKQNYFEGEKLTGTNHGTWNPYDTHVPLLWYGWGIKKGVSYRQINLTDIAPTLAALLHIQMPNGCVGKVIEEMLD